MVNKLEHQHVILLLEAIKVGTKIRFIITIILIINNIIIEINIINTIIVIIINAFRQSDCLYLQSCSDLT